MNGQRPRSAAEELTELLRHVDFSSTSTTKYAMVEDWFKKRYGFPNGAVYMSTVSGGSKNLTVRVRQSLPSGSRHWPVFIAVQRNEDEIESALEVARSLVGPPGARPAGIIILCYVAPNRTAEFRAVVEAEESHFARRLKKDFPDLEVRQPEPVDGDYRVVPEAAPSTRLDLGDRMESLAGRLGVGIEWLRDVRWALEEKRAIVLYGPPGTGKTFIAQRLAEALQPDAERRRIVQLHPSYSYEDFFEGYRPHEAASGITLKKQDGPLRDLVRLALAHPEEPVVLVLDEMNRGNLPKVFGELYFLLEYRDQAVSLMYSPGERFTLPENLVLIGSMNTADRSIVLIDQALRRRFHFFGLFPGERPVSDMLRRYLHNSGSDMLWAADLLDEVNRRLGERHNAIGPSYFMRPDLDEEVLDRVWHYSIKPTLEDHFFSEPGRMADFELEELKALVKSRAARDDEP